MEVLARTAVLMLETGDWWGIHSAAGWVPNLSDAEDWLWHVAATLFVSTYDRRQPCMNEPFVWLAADDLATELLYHRGWCPHKPWDKHVADEADNPVALEGDLELLLFECQCSAKVRRVHEGAPVTTSPEAPYFAARDHSKYGPARDASLLGRLVDWHELPFVGHGVFIRGPVDG
jgi:hypothetical protein